MESDRRDDKADARTAAKAMFPGRKHRTDTECRDMAIYDGPILDSHHHIIWDWQTNYPWMSGPMRPMIFNDDWSGMKRDYRIEDLLDDFAPHNVTASVHVQANFDKTRPLDETKALQAMHDAHGFPTGIVAYADLTSPDAARVIDAHLAHAATRGIRHQVYWHATNKYWQYVDRKDYCLSDAFRSGLAAVEARNLTFDWQGFSNQFGDLAALARDFPDLRFCLVHAGMLTDLGSATVSDWDTALDTLLPCDNVFIKVSGLNTYSRELDEPLMDLVSNSVLDKFGVDRCFFGSNYPVERMWTSFGDYVNAQKRVVAGRSAADQQKFFHDTAMAFYRL
jgi:predicted TIM-barrel fold metal-dependent hydrolase